MEKQRNIERNIIGKKLTFAKNLIQRVIQEKQGSVIRENIHSDYADFAGIEKNSKGKGSYIHNDYADFEC